MDNRLETLKDWVGQVLALREYEVRPASVEQDLARGYLLLTDLGQQMYLPQLNESTVERLYGDALGALVVLQAGIFTDPGFLPEYAAVLLRREVELFREWYLGRHLGVTLR